MITGEPSIISIIIPCRNEQPYILPCLESVLAFECPNELTFEVLVMDGRSDDQTVALASEVALHDARVRILDNPGRIQSTAVNLGVKAAKGYWIMRLDAHSIYPPDYMRLCYETSVRSGADNVGGIFVTMVGGPGYSAMLVQGITTHRFGVGDSGFRTDGKEAITDTVPYGFFRRTIFDRIGWFDERLIRAQDYEFNRRIGVTGGKVLRNDEIRISYFNQPTLAAFYLKQILKEAPYNAYMWYLAPYSFAPRHAVTAIFVIGLIVGTFLASVSHVIALCLGGILALYFILGTGAAIQQAIRYRKPLHILFLPMCFFGYHFIHGVGVVGGLLCLAVGKAPVQLTPEPWPGAGRRRAWPLRTPVVDTATSG